MKEFKKLYLLECLWKVDPDWEGVRVAAVI